MVEYPGFVKNDDKALATLGGTDAISRAFHSQKDRLELKFRKTDPLAHAVYGDKTPKKCLVLRIQRAKSSEQAGTSQESTYSISVIGKIQTVFKFETLAEFQWLPIQRTNFTPTIKPEELHTGSIIRRTRESLDPTYASILDEILPIMDPFDNTLKSFNPDAPLLLLPAVFSRFDSPREIHQPHPKFRSKEMRDEFERQQSLSIIGRTRKKRSTMSYLISFGDAIPQKPPEKLVKERAMMSNQERSLVPKLKACFDRQKVWSKASLCYDLNCSTLDIKYILPLLAYHYLNGPFRTMWVKYGYDPHKDHSSKILQTLDFRVKNPHETQEYSKRSIHQYQLPMRKNAEKIRSKQQLDLKSIISGVSTTSGYLDATEDSLTTGKGQIITEAMCKFRRDLAPAARQLSYQLKDIELEEVQSLIHNNDGKEPAVCSERDGWLPEGSIDKIRKIMTKCLNDTIDLMSSQLYDPTPILEE